MALPPSYLTPRQSLEELHFWGGPSLLHPLADAAGLPPVLPLSQLSTLTKPGLFYEGMPAGTRHFLSNETLCTEPAGSCQLRACSRI